MRNRRVFWLLSFCWFLVSLGAEAASLQSIPPSVMEQLRSMPPAEAQRLARQYGIDLETLAGTEPAGGPAAGQQGVPLVPVQAAAQQREEETESLEEQREEASVSGVIQPLDPAERFGLSFFDAEVSTFSPVDSFPVPQDYRLGPGDELKIFLLGQESGELSLTVDRTGSVVLPGLGVVAVAGMSFESAAGLLRERISKERIGVQATIAMGRLRTINVMLAGEVRVPGARSLSALSRVTHALFASGGVSAVGSLRDIQVKRGGVLLGRFDTYDLLLEGNAEGDLQLHDGDVVFVPPVERLGGVGGAVRRPGVFELAPGESLQTLLTMAGGITARGQRSGILLERERPDGGPEILQFDASALAKIPAEAGDRLRIQVASQRFSNRVRLSGAVQRPGVYGFFDGMRLSDLIRDFDVDLLEETDLSYGIVISINPLDGRIDVRQFSPTEVLARNQVRDLELMPRDSVLIFSRPRSESVKSDRASLLAPVLALLDLQATPDRPVKTARIEGAVQAPGRYPLGQAYTPKDLIDAAGGLRGDAYQDSIEIQRVALSEDSIAEVRTLEVGPGRGGIDTILLQSRDRVSVRAIPNWRPDETVVLSGEFRFPGEYSLLPGETLSELIERVGGVSSKAFPYGAVYTAIDAAEREREETQRFADDIRRAFASASLTQQGQQATFQELELAVSSLLEGEALGRIAIDLPRILAGDEAADIVLSDGDKLFLPRRKDSVTVLGEVFRPGSFRFEAGQSLEDYVALGAGLTPRADGRGIYIVRADGRVTRSSKSLLRFNLASEAVRPGDTVVVPVNSDYRDPLEFWSSITQVAYQTGIAIAAVLRN